MISLSNHYCKKRFPEMKSYRVKEEAKSRILTQQLCLQWELKSTVTVNEFQWYLRKESKDIGRWLPEYLGRVRLGIFRNKNVFRNIFRLFCSQEQNSQNGIQVFRNENSSQTNAYLHYSNYSYSGLIPNERALIFIKESSSWINLRKKLDTHIEHYFVLKANNCESYSKWRGKQV